MTKSYKCPRCSQLPPPPSIFSLGPPPNILSMEFRCSSHMLSPSSIVHAKVTSSSSSFVSVTLGIMIALLITTGTIILIKNQIIKRRKRCQRKYNHRSSSTKFNGYNHDRYWTNFLSLLSDSVSSDQTFSTPSTEYPCGFIEPLLPNDIHHEYEQIRYHNPSHYYSLVYCRQCANYHQVSSSLSSLCRQTNLSQSYYQHQCTCHLRNDNHSFELQPMLETNSVDASHQPLH